MTKPLSKILLVDDEPDIHEVAKMSLEIVGGFEIETCNSGKEAISRVGDISPDLILMDVMMPEMNGPDAFSEMQNNGSVDDIPVVFMTAKVQPDEVNSYKEMGAAEVIAKPFDPMTLADRVRAIWDSVA